MDMDPRGVIFVKMQHNSNFLVYPVADIQNMNSVSTRYLLNRVETAKSTSISNAPQINATDLVSHISPMFKVRNDRRIKLHELIPLYIDLVKVLGRTATSTVYDSSFTFSSGTYRNLITIKTSPAIAMNSLSLEFLVGYYYMNSLRRYIPNFMQTYGYFTCGESSSMAHDTGRVQSFCSASSPQTSYLVIEKIGDSMTAHQYMKTCSRTDACNIYLQVFLSLLVAREKVNFSHYDLHANNVLIKNLGKYESITYECYGRTYTITTNIVAVIIDYGRSRVGTDLSLASTHCTRESSPYMKSKIETDMYYFFASTIVMRGDMDDYNIIYSIFTKNDPSSKLQGVNGVIAQRQYYFTYPEDLSDRDIFKIVDILKERYDGYNLSNRGLSSYQGGGDTGYIYPLVINSTLEYYEALPTKYVFTSEKLSKILQDSINLIGKLSLEVENEQNVDRNKHLSLILRTVMKLHVVFVEDNFPISSSERMNINAYRDRIKNMKD